MKKPRILVLALVVAVMLMGAGYAAWTNTLTIGTRVTTGTLDVNFASGATALVYKTASATQTDVQSDSIAHPNTGVVDTMLNGSVVPDSKTVTVDNLYPGAHVVVTIPVVSASTIPVIYDATTSSITDHNSTTTFSNPHVNVARVGTPPALTTNGSTGNLVYTIDVPSSETGFMNGTVTFDINTTWKQFNE